jgi:hypothetical protein
MTMPPTEPVEDLILRQVEAYPATNITRLFRHAGKQLPEAIGGGCLWMAAQVARLLRARKPGITVTHYNLGTPGSHTTTVSDDGTDRKLYEPSSFQVQPFSLTRFASDRSCCTSDTFPPKGGKLTFRWTTPATLRMELVSPRNNPLRTLDYKLDVPVPLNVDDPYAGLPFLDAQDQLYIHLLNSDGSKSVLMLGTRTKRLNVGRAWDRLFIETEPGFDSRFEAVAQRLGLTSKELRALLGEALEIHNAQYPQG